MIYIPDTVWQSLEVETALTDMAALKDDALKDALKDMAALKDAALKDALTDMAALRDAALRDALQGGPSLTIGWGKV